MVKFYRKHYSSCYKVMRITTVLIGIQACFTTILLAGALEAQPINLNADQVSVKQVFINIEKQAGVTFIYDEKMLEGLNKISIKAINEPLTEVLKSISSQVPLQFKQSGAVIGVVRISVKPHPKAPVSEKAIPLNSPPVTVSGKVIDEKGQPLAGATIKIKNSNFQTSTNEHGVFRLDNIPDSAILVVSYIGFKSKEVRIRKGASNIVITLESDASSLKEVVVSTGYQDIPKERETGSFDLVNNELVNRRVSTNILDRIDGITSGVYFNGTADNSINASGYSPRNSGINIRGQSTINASVDPLIVVDNFPYAGQISNINPNDVESITILKDAAAASIWGANAANGVIVITTKKGRLNQKMRVELNASVTVGNKPNLFYDKNFLNSSDYIDVETYLFKQGYFDNDLSNTYSYPALSPVVSLLAQARDGTISEASATNQINALRQNDVRNDFEKYVYQKSVDQQYSLGINGGGSDYTYALSVGLDNNRDNLIRNGFDRTTVKSTNAYTPFKNLTLTADLNYSQNTTFLNNAYGYGDLSAYAMGNGEYNTLYPYAQLADSKGNSLIIPKNYGSSYINSTQAEGFLDWNFRPLDEIKNSDNTTKVNDLLLRFSALYKIIPQLSAQIQYQNEHQIVDLHNFQSQDTYYTRNLINEFAEYTPGSPINYIFPLGGILNSGNYDWESDNLRAQLNYNQSFKKNVITAIAGSELRQQKTDGYNSTSYGYNNNYGTAVSQLNYNTYYNTNPSGSNLIPAPQAGTAESLYRYLSYFANAAYTYDERYVLNLSGRKDGANLFGAKTNDKITPLWSAGLGWNASKESFYAVGWLPYLRLRATYGFNGNVYNGTAYLRGNYTTAPTTGANAILIADPPNPELRWERVKNINFGLDLGTKGDRITGTIEFYRKDGEDLVEPTPLATQTGFTTFTANTANTKSHGTDITIQSRNLTGALKWNTTLLFSTLDDKLTKYDVASTSSSIQVTGGIPGIVGYPLYSIFSYKWAGLDPANGNPRGYLNGQVSENYSGIINNYAPANLVYNGSARPTVYGSFRNDFSYKGFSLSANIKYELGFVFRRPSITGNYTDILTYYANSDYDNRWQQPGDELHTNVPSLIYPGDNNRSEFYTYSQVLVQSGNNIRLQDIRLGYDIPASWLRNKPFQRLQVYAYANNIGIIWRENKYGIDPDAYGFGLTHTLPNPFTISFGVNANF